MRRYKMTILGGALVRRLLLLSVGLLLAVAKPSEGQSDQLPGREWAASVNLTNQNVKATGVLFLPAAVDRVRAVIVFNNYGRLELLSDSLAWRQAAASVDAAILLARITEIDMVHSSPVPVEKMVWRNAMLGGGEAVLRMLQQLASEVNHPELGSAPLVFWGWSAGAGFGATFAEQQPTRTLADVRYHIQQRTLLVNTKVVGGIPMLMMAGGKDTTAGHEDAEKLWQSGRTIDAPWTYVLEPNVPHPMNNAEVEFITNGNSLMIPWVTAVIRQRLGPSGVGLRAIDVSAGWAGDNDTGAISQWSAYKGSPQNRVWLQDQLSAQGWQIIRQADNPGKPLQ
jgi:hypothetical protein